MTTGYIKLYRSIQDNPKWLAEEFSRQQAWIDLLLLANHKPTVVYIAGHRIDVQRGELAWSAVNLAKRWRWSKSKFWRFMDELERDCQTTHRNAVLTTVISIVNYERYQSCDTPNESPNESPNDTPSESPSDTQTIMVRMKRNKNTPLPPLGEVGDVDGGTLFKLESDTPVNPKDRIQWNQPTGWSGITDDDKKQWQDAYPACNVEQKLKALGVWVRDNWPKSRKKNWARFISNNLSRSQERGGDHTANWTNKTPSRAIQTFSTGITDDGRAPFWWRKYLVKLYEPLGQAKIDEFMAVKYFKDLPLSVQQDCNQEYAKERDDLKY